MHCVCHTVQDAMRDHGVDRFSPSAAANGEPTYVPIDEKHAKTPINPYGRSKAMVEEILADLSVAHDFGFVALRYFNAAGASSADGLAELHAPETHLIPLAIRSTAKGSPGLRVYGDDCPRSTCLKPELLQRDQQLAPKGPYKGLWIFCLVKILSTSGRDRQIGGEFCSRFGLARSANLRALFGSREFIDLRPQPKDAFPAPWIEKRGTSFLSAPKDPTRAVG